MLVNILILLLWLKASKLVINSLYPFLFELITLIFFGLIKIFFDEVNERNKSNICVKLVPKEPFLILYSIEIFLCL